MPVSSSSRRVLGLLAAGTIGVSGALLGSIGVASAAPAPVPTSVVDGSDGDQVLAETTAAASTVSFAVPAGVCAVRFAVAGGSGAVAGSQGGAAGLVATTVRASVGQSFTLVGGDAAIPPGVDGQQSTVTGGNGFSITAAGGSGTSTPRAANSLSPNAVSIEADNAVDGSTAGTQFAGGPGVSLAVGVACPKAPESVSARGADGSVQLRFSVPVDDPDEPLDDDLSFMVSVDGGSFRSLPVTSVDPTIREVAGTVGGLTNGTPHTFAVRTVSYIGSSAPTATRTATPYLPIGAPQGLTVTRTDTTATVSFSAPTTAGTYALDGYSVGYGGREMGDEACRLPVGVTTCTFPLPAGADVSITVFALDAGFQSSLPATVQSPPVVPATVPTKDDGDITGPAGPITAVQAGQELTLQGLGFAPLSTVQLTLFSAPVSLGTTVTDADGRFSVRVTLPAGLTAGTHTLVATGINPDGTTRYLVTTVTVAASGDGVAGAPALAATGADTAVPLAGGVAALLVGAGLLVGARRRS